MGRGDDNVDELLLKTKKTHARAQTHKKVEMFKPSGDFGKGNERRRTVSDMECEVGDRVIAVPLLS